jgi:predicted ribosomally synthesized peptide with nif11-like leader
MTMSLHQLDAFLAYARSQPELAPRLMEPLDLEELLTLASSHGFVVAEADVIAAQLREEERLSAAELQKRAGDEARRLRTFIPG